MMYKIMKFEKSMWQNIMKSIKNKMSLVNIQIGVSFFFFFF